MPLDFYGVFKIYSTLPGLGHQKNLYPGTHAVWSAWKKDGFGLHSVADPISFYPTGMHRAKNNLSYKPV